MILFSLIGFSLAGPAIKQYDNLITCDPKGTLRQVVEVDRSKLKTTAFVFKKKSFKRQRLNFQSICNGKRSGTPFAFTFSSNLISGEVPLNECGHYGDASNFGGVYDGMSLKHFFIAPPVTKLETFQVVLFYRNFESETYNEFANCTMKFVDPPKAKVKEPKAVVVELNSTPPGADVYNEKGMVGSTPFKVKLKPDESMNLTVRKQGFLEKSIVISSQSINPTIVLDPEPVAEEEKPAVQMKVVVPAKKLKKKPVVKTYTVKVSVPVLPSATLNKRLRAKGKKILKKRAKKAGLKKLKGKVKVATKPKCNVLKNKCTAKVKASFKK